MLRSVNRILKNVTPKMLSVRTMTHYPIDDAMFGLNEEQISVSFATPIAYQKMELTTIFSWSSSYVKQFLTSHRRN
jgi:hypothetical protein